MSDRSDLTLLLRRLSGGDDGAYDALLPVVYDELQRIAHRQLRGEREDHTLSTTDLVHEAFERLVGLDAVAWQDRAHFFGVAAGAMRRVLVDWARARAAAKRGGGVRAVSLDREAAVGIEVASTETTPDELLVLDDALSRLATLSSRQARVVECRYFAGLSVEETAEALSISETTVKADWRLARAWLHDALAA